MAVTGIRDYLKSKGLTDDQITYNNGTVYAKGQRFTDATPDADGITRADASQLENNWKNYDMQDQISQLKSKAQTLNPQLTTLQQGIAAKVQAQPKEFNYDVKNSAEYQAAINRAKANAQTASNNALVATGSRGIGNSSIASDRVAQIQQREMSNVEDTIVPQLVAQAYQKYMGQQQLDQQQLSNMMNYANQLNSQDQQQFSNQAQILGLQNNYNQQQFQNERALTAEERQKQQDHISLANTLTQLSGKFVNPTDEASQSYAQIEGITPLAMQQYLQSKAVQEAGLTGQYNGQDTMDAKKFAADQAYQQAQLKIAQQNADTAAANASTRASSSSASKTQQAGFNDMVGKVNEIFSNNDMGDYERRQFLISLNLPDEDTIRLLNYYKLPVQAPKVNVGGR